LEPDGVRPDIIEYIGQYPDMLEIMGKRALQIMNERIMPFTEHLLQPVLMSYHPERLTQQRVEISNRIFDKISLLVINSLLRLEKDMNEVNPWLSDCGIEQFTDDAMAWITENIRQTNAWPENLPKSDIYAMFAP